jgi:hypothetical protein
MHDPKLGRALAGKNTPSILEKEAAFEDAYARVQASGVRGPRSLRTWLWLASTGLAAAGVLWLARPAPLTPPQEDFTARGGGEASKFDFELSCVSRSEPGKCRTGDKLAVRVQAPSGRYFAAFARRSDGVVIWYWPSAGGKSLPAAKLATLDAKAQAVVLDAAHTPGEYAVYGVLSKRALDRDEIKAELGAEFRGNAETLVKSHSLSVSAP